MLSLVTLTMLSMGTFFAAKKIRIPYTVLLVVVGLLLIPLAKLPFFSYIGSFHLTPELLFFVFLPTLIFESAYNMNIVKVVESIRSISLLAVASLIVSAFAAAAGLYYGFQWIGLPIPFSVTLLFGALISATDPVAVLALFKEYGAPRRLSLIFEGESLFNDGTSLALFLIILDIVIRGYHGPASIIDGTLIFAIMVAGGILLGIAIGGIFSKIIERVKDNEYVEITLTLVVAHLTFLLSEIINHYAEHFGSDIRLSSIIATVIAAMVVGNYGRYKISPRVEEYMEKFWGYFAFLCNSIVFVLIGLLFASLPLSLSDLIVPGIVTILVIAAGRAISIYPIIGLLNLSRTELYIPQSWQHLLAWGSLRGALAITMVLLIPDTLTVAGWSHAFTVKEFIMGLTIVCIYFTLFVKATTIGPVMRRLRLTDLTDLEKIEREETKLLIYNRLLVRLTEFRDKRYINEKTYERIKKEYEGRCRNTGEAWNTISRGEGRRIERVLHLHALGIEKHVLKSLFTYDEVDEKVFKKILDELDRRRARIASMEDMAATTESETSKKDIFEKALYAIVGNREETYTSERRYMYHRAKRIIARKAVRGLTTLKEGGVALAEATLFEQVLAHYAAQEESSRRAMQTLEHEHVGIVQDLNDRFAARGLYKEEESILHELREKEMITPKLATVLTDELRAETAQV